MNPQLNATWAYAASEFRCDPVSIHGPAHWRRVLDVGVAIGKQVSADILVVQLFAALHDHQRDHDSYDTEHGHRAANTLASLRGKVFDVTDSQLDLLDYAIRHHTDGLRANDATIGACWDADRLDLGRVGISPSPEFMSTLPGRDAAQKGTTYWLLGGA